MKKDNSLQNFADQSLSEFHNEKIFTELKAVIENNSDGKQRKRKKRNIVLGTSIATVVIVMVTVFLIICVPFFNQPTVEKNYNVGNQDTVETDLESMNLDLTQVNFILDSDISIDKIVDKSYDETLYYNFTIKYDLGMALEVFVVINEEYNFPFDHTYDRIEDLGTLHIAYTESFKSLEPNMYYVETFGALETHKEKIYMSYNGIVFEENSGFIENIIQIIETKG